MAIAHVCMQCGMALTRLRPSRDPHYRLPIVTCTNCGQAWVRRRHPIQQRWRAYTGVQTSVCTILLKMLLLVPLIAATVGIIMGVESMLQEVNLRYALRHERWSLAYMTIPLPVLVGIWLTAGLSHWRRWMAWAAWTGLIGCLLAIEPIIEPLLGRLAELCGLSVTPASFAVDQWLHRLGILGATMVIATAGIPLGRGLQAAFARHRAHRWRKRRRRLRARRAGA